MQMLQGGAIVEGDQPQRPLRHDQATLAMAFPRRDRLLIAIDLAEARVPLLVAIRNAELPRRRVEAELPGRVPVGIAYVVLPVQAPDLVDLGRLQRRQRVGRVSAG